MNIYLLNANKVIFVKEHIQRIITVNAIRLHNQGLLSKNASPRKIPIKNKQLI